jgi:hypothetical protein
MKQEVISRRKALSLLGLAALAMPCTVLTPSDAEAQQPTVAQATPPATPPPSGQPGVQPGPQTGTERRQERRTGRTERRQERRTGRTERRQERRKEPQ